MENNKFKQLPYQDEFELWRNISRMMVVVFYAPTAVLMFMTAGIEGNHEFILEMSDWPLNRYIMFFVPLIVCAMNLQMLFIEKRSRVPMPRVSRHFLYASLVVSFFFYGIFVAAIFH